LLRHSGGWDTSMGLDLSAPFAKTLFPEIINDKFLAPFDPQYDALKLASPDRNNTANATDLIKFMMKFPLNFVPGTREKYSNLGYNILGRIIEVISGDPYDVFIQNNIFGPADFEYSAFIGSEQITNKNVDETFYFDGPEDNPEYSVVAGVSYRTPASYGSFILDVMDAHGGWVMTATDLSKVGARMLNLGYFNQSVFDEILKRPSYVDPAATTFYSLGMSVTNMPDGDIMLSHNGALTFGTFGFIGMMINKKLVLSVITNHIDYNIPVFLGSFSKLVMNLFSRQQQV
jgi:CubicO group peptidase (beta-lactamase class C family)